MDERCEAGMAMYTKSMVLGVPNVNDLQPMCPGTWSAIVAQTYLKGLLDRTIVHWFTCSGFQTNSCKISIHYWYE